MIKSNKYIKALQLRDKYKNALLVILESQKNNKVGKRIFPIYFENWAGRLLKLEYLIIDLKYKVQY